MKKDTIFELWLSEYTIEEIAEMLNLEQIEVEKELINYVKSLNIEEGKMYGTLWSEYNFTKEMFINIFKETDLIYNYLDLLYPKGNKHPIYLMNDASWCDKVLKYLAKVNIAPTLENETVTKEVQKKFKSKLPIEEDEMLEIGFIYEDKFAYYYTNFAISQDLFCKVFRVTRQGYAYLENRFTNGEKDFEIFCQDNPGNQYAQRYKLSKNINKVVDLKQITNQLNTLFEAKQAEVDVEEVTLKPTPKSSTTNEPSKDIENLQMLFNDKFLAEHENIESQVNYESEVKETPQHKVTLEIFEPSFSWMFNKTITNFELEDKNKNFVSSHKIDFRSIEKIKLQHTKTKPKNQNKETFDTIANYNAIIRNVKPRFDVKKKNK